MRPTPSELDEEFCVMAFPARTTKSIVCSGGLAQMAMLGVVGKKDALQDYESTQRRHISVSSTGLLYLSNPSIISPLTSNSLRIRFFDPNAIDWETLHR
jgi:hypothetical protein